MEGQLLGFLGKSMLGNIRSEMPALITSNAVEECLRNCLRSEGFDLNNPRGHGETGVDIKARKGSTVLAIEVIGFKSSPPQRAKDFYEAFFRAVSRLNDESTRCIIALPARFRQGLPARASQHRVAWNRIATAFPELEIWLVDTEKQCYEISAWGSWLSNALSRAATP